MKSEGIVRLGAGVWRDGRAWPATRPHHDWCHPEQTPTKYWARQSYRSPLIQTTYSLSNLAEYSPPHEYSFKRKPTWDIPLRVVGKSWHRCRYVRNVGHSFCNVLRLREAPHKAVYSHHSLFEKQHSTHFLTFHASLEVNTTVYILSSKKQLLLWRNLTRRI